mmetsp:Transcript_57011/g.180431  ORF Transcript_57011/g.180431 Transcript_57011/m.180431 type:complete len:218 (-) Transcript_57011:310-963(-)
MTILPPSASTCFSTACTAKLPVMRRRRQSSHPLKPSTLDHVRRPRARPRWQEAPRPRGYSAIRRHKPVEDVPPEHPEGEEQLRVGGCYSRVHTAERQEAVGCNAAHEGGGGVDHGAQPKGQTILRHDVQRLAAELHKARRAQDPHSVSIDATAVQALPQHYDREHPSSHSEPKGEHEPGSVAQLRARHPVHLPLRGIAAHATPPEPLPAEEENGGHD